MDQWNFSISNISALQQHHPCLSYLWDSLESRTLQENRPDWLTYSELMGPNFQQSRPSVPDRCPHEFLCMCCAGVCLAPQVGGGKAAGGSSRMCQDHNHMNGNEVPLL